MSIIPQSTRDFINAVTNPFDCSVPARVPDNDVSQSLSLKDFIAQNGFNVTINGTTTVCSGVAIGLVIGFNQLANAGLYTQVPYTLYVIPLDASGVKIGISTISWTNYASLSTYTSIFRYVGGGIRLKCLIEDVTVSTTIAVARHYAGLIKNFEVYTAYNSSTNFYNLANQMDCLKIYNNAEGASIRLDPFQQIVDFKKYRAVGDWNAQASFNGNSYIMPFCVTQFMNPVTLNTVAGNTTYTFPLIMEAVMWIEGLLLKPSPLFMTASPCDMNFENLAQVIATQCGGEFPLVSKFNSFSNFLRSVGKISKAAGKAIANSSILPQLGNIAVNQALTYATGVPMNVSLFKQRKKKSNGNNNNNNNNNKRGNNNKRRLKPQQMSMPLHGNQKQKGFNASRPGKKTTRF